MAKKKSASAVMRRQREQLGWLIVVAKLIAGFFAFAYLHDWLAGAGIPGLEPYLWGSAGAAWLAWRVYRYAMTPTAAAPAKKKRPAMPVDLRYDIYERDGHCCLDCGRSPRTHPGCVLHIEHWLPWWAYPHLYLAAWNLRTACDKCNYGKGRRIPAMARNWNKGGRIMGPSVLYLKRAA